jgi:hypothetical protein
MGQDFTLFPETIALLDVGYLQPSVRDDRGQAGDEGLHLQRLHSLLYLEGILFSSCVGARTHLQPLLVGLYIHITHYGLLCVSSSLRSRSTAGGFRV